MERITLKLPNKISAFIGRNYPGYSLICTKENDDRNGHRHYLVDLVKEDTYYHLKINDVGALVTEESEPVYCNEYQEQFY